MSRTSSYSRAARIAAPLEHHPECLARPSGSWVATGGADVTARVWDADMGETPTPHRSPGEVNGVAFDPSGSWVATAGNDGTTRVWGSDTGESLAILISHTSWVLGAAFDPSGRRVATASADGTARVWDATPGECVLTLTLACSGPLARHGNRLAVTAGWQRAVIELPADELDLGQIGTGVGPRRG